MLTLLNQANTPGKKQLTILGSMAQNLAAPPNAME